MPPRTRRSGPGEGRFAQISRHPGNITDTSVEHRRDDCPLACPTSCTWRCPVSISDALAAHFERRPLHLVGKS